MRCPVLTQRMAYGGSLCMHQKSLDLRFPKHSRVTRVLVSFWCETGQGREEPGPSGVDPEQHTRRGRVSYVQSAISKAVASSMCDVQCAMCNVQWPMCRCAD
eukprot:2273093-Rhodomonas_salina.1